jgi:hypothetical protein
VETNTPDNACQRELQETQKLESLGLLAGGVAHDFNSLLTGVLDNASLVLADVAHDQSLKVAGTGRDLARGDSGVAERYRFVGCDRREG